MLTGFNTDFRYKGIVYHVQTEDNGVNNPSIVTLLYRGGAILASRKTSYADILKFEKLDKVVRELMEEQHKQVIRDLVGGRFGATGDPDSQAGPVESKTGSAGPGVETESTKGLDEVILDYLSSEGKEK